MRPFRSPRLGGWRRVGPGVFSTVQLLSSRPGTHRERLAEGTKVLCEKLSVLRGASRKAGINAQEKGIKMFVLHSRRGCCLPHVRASLTKWLLPTGGPSLERQSHSKVLMF